MITLLDQLESREISLGPGLKLEGVFPSMELPKQHGSTYNCHVSNMTMLELGKHAQTTRKPE